MGNKKIKIQITCEICDDAAEASQEQIMEWIEYELGVGSLSPNNPMEFQEPELLHLGHITSIKIE